MLGVISKRHSWVLIIIGKVWFNFRDQNLDIRSIIINVSWIIEQRFLSWVLVITVTVLKENIRLLLRLILPIILISDTYLYVLLLLFWFLFFPLIVDICYLSEPLSDLWLWLRIDFDMLTVPYVISTMIFFKILMVASS